MKLSTIILINEKYNNTQRLIANSAFSWWAAYFNNTPGKIVVYPNTWFGSMNYDKSTKDLFPPSWIPC